MENRPSVKSRMPTFDTIAEAATFWDEHDTTEFEDEWEPADIEVVGPPRHRLSVTFDSKTFRRMLAQARKQGIGPTAFVHASTLEALDRAAAADTDAAGNGVASE